MQHIIQRESGLFYNGGYDREVVRDADGKMVYEDNPDRLGQMSQRIVFHPYGWTPDASKARVYKRRCDASNSINARNLRGGSDPIKVRVVPIQIVPVPEPAFT